MSVCPVCSAPTETADGVCERHGILGYQPLTAAPPDYRWSDGNRAVCDFVHRSFAPRRRQLRALRRRRLR